jgi:hypothetical protein
MTTRRAARAFHLYQNAHVNQIVQIALAKQQSPAERTRQ